MRDTHVGALERVQKRAASFIWDQLGLSLWTEHENMWLNLSYNVYHTLVHINFHFYLLTPEFLL